MDMKALLKKANDNFKETRDTPAISDGVYICQMQSCAAALSNSGGIMIKREHLILEGPSANEVVRDSIYIGPPGQLNRIGVRQASVFCKIMGHPMDELTELEDVCAAIANDAPTYQATVKNQTGTDFYNVTVTKLVDAAGAAPAEAASADAEAPTSSEEWAVDDQVKFTDGETNTEHTATIKAIQETTVHAEIEDGTLVEVDKGSLTRVDAEAPAEEDAERVELLAFITSHGCEGATDESTVEQLKEVILGYEYKASENTPEENALLKKLGAKFEAEAVKKALPKPTPKPAPKASVKPAPKPTPKPAPKQAPKVTKPTPKKK